MKTAELVNHVDDLPAYLNVLQVAARLNIGRSMVYELMGSGRLRSVSIGRCRRIPRHAMLEYEASLTGGTLPDDDQE